MGEHIKAIGFWLLKALAWLLRIAAAILGVAGLVVLVIWAIQGLGGRPHWLLSLFGYELHWIISDDGFTARWVSSSGQAAQWFAPATGFEPLGATIAAVAGYFLGWRDTLLLEEADGFVHVP